MPGRDGGCSDGDEGLGGPQRKKPQDTSDLQNLIELAQPSEIALARQYLDLAVARDKAGGKDLHGMFEREVAGAEERRQSV